MKIVEHKMDVLKNLLFELDEICKKNNLNYTLTGNVARSIHEQGTFPEEFDYITVAMTSGDIERFIAIVNGENRPERQVEYLLNNPYARGLQIRYCNSETTAINVKEFGHHINYGFYVKIKPIQKTIADKREKKLLDFYKKAWTGSMKRLKSCNWKLVIPVVLLKAGKTVVGSKRLAKMLYNYNRKLRFIDTWDDIMKEDYVQIGFAKFSNVKSDEILVEEVDDEDSQDEKMQMTDEATDFIAEEETTEDQYESWELIPVEVEGRTLTYCLEGLHQKIVKEPSHNTVLINNIEDTSISFREAIDRDVAQELYETQLARNKYLRTLSKSKKAVKVMNKSWRTYLMTRDVVAFREMYTEDVIESIRKSVNEVDFDRYKELMRPYLISRKRWRRKKIEFIENPVLEAIIVEAKNVFEQVK